MVSSGSVRVMRSESRINIIILFFHSFIVNIGCKKRKTKVTNQWCCDKLLTMEKDYSFLLKEPITKEDALTLHPMALAFIGDAVQSLYTRTRVTVGKTSKTGILHQEVIKVVSATSQSEEAEKILPLFDETEQDIFRRARNCKVQTSAKHAEMSEYRRASGLEAVFGYLYLIGNTERLNHFLSLCYDNKKQ